MKRLILATSMALLVALVAVSGITATAYAFSSSGDRTQLTTPGLTPADYVYRYREWRDNGPVVVERDYDNPIVVEHYRPYYVEPYPYTTYYYEPGVGIDVPFFHFRIF